MKDTPLSHHGVGIWRGVQQFDLRMAGKTEVSFRFRQQNRVSRRMRIVAVRASTFGKWRVADLSLLVPGRKIRVTGKTEISRLFRQQGGVVGAVGFVAHRAFTVRGRLMPAPASFCNGFVAFTAQPVFAVGEEVCKGTPMRGMAGRALSIGEGGMLDRHR